MLAAAGDDALVVDLAGLTFLDSAAVHLLFRLVRRFQERGRRLAFVVPAESAASRVIEIIDLAAAAPVVHRPRRGRGSALASSGLRSRLGARSDGSRCARGAEEREQRRLLGIEAETAGADDPQRPRPEVARVCGHRCSASSTAGAM